jgi:hypothetical protein
MRKCDSIILPLNKKRGRGISFSEGELDYGEVRKF